mmetsp:Transcript_65282/g.156015  ORF Transcript_65282/g.156015 Transcript_65282/m.156015 type:complete len:274 (+) Transcript_65282:88-909(+)|eukprot:CAMPEP_0178422200 /NCGR_PEP_ID=MMETSP0689_2-20121128/27048_1 /TAXON_ID=160604 /ORGANISM="Amphidinium massartii, Strain CS-259" /LENGTH=273 /DNA_ID=CAMNT_0020043751 /DNA_START=80 /DNA_END=901 /DNA_ORIENTATION=-
MGNSASEQNLDPVPCSHGTAKEELPLSVQTEVARAATAAGVSAAVSGKVVGHTGSKKLQELGAESFMLALGSSRSLKGRSSQQDASAVAVRAPGRLSFLPGIALPASGVYDDPDGDPTSPRLRWNGWEVIVLGRPDTSFKRLSQLPLDCLKMLLPEGSVVDLRVLRPTVPCAADADGVQLKSCLLQLNVILEETFAMPTVPPGSTAMFYEYHVPDAISNASWLVDAGIAMEETKSCEHDAYEDGASTLASLTNPCTSLGGRVFMAIDLSLPES